MDEVDSGVAGAQQMRTAARTAKESKHGEHGTVAAIVHSPRIAPPGANRLSRPRRDARSVSGRRYQIRLTGGESIVILAEAWSQVWILQSLRLLRDVVVEFSPKQQKNWILV
ncbi:MAG TPA: hypothetical protein VFJ16_22945 [Longimicrobium sp.]|nr:hypothetical protein [Longimicrobium sp.]